MSRIFYHIDLYSMQRYDHYSNQKLHELLYSDFLHDIVIRPKTLFRKEEKLVLRRRDLYLYEENGIFYEFFSGRIVGERKAPIKASGNYKEPDLIVRNGYTLTTFRDYGTLDYTIKQLPATKFATEVEAYVPYKSHMAAEMSKLLDAIDALIKKYHEDVLKANENKLTAEQKSQSWLDSIIGSK